MKKVTLTEADYELIDKLTDAQAGQFIKAMMKANITGEMIMTGDLTVDIALKPYLSKAAKKVKPQAANEEKKVSPDLWDESLLFIRWIQKVMSYSSYVVKSETDNKRKAKFQLMYLSLRSKDYSKEQIKQAVLYAINDDFWRKNFQSPMKLVDRSQKAGMTYIDLFISQSNAKAKPMEPVIPKPQPKQERSILD